MSADPRRILARLEVAADIASYAKPQQRIAANGPTARQVASDALALPRVEGDADLRAKLEAFVRQA